MKNTLFVLVALLLSAGISAQKKMTPEEYIDKFKETAMMEMVDYKIPASITLAQGIYESGSGNSDLARKANNHFGIKCHKDWKGKAMYKDDDEKNECFRWYDNASESYRDHSLFLAKGQRYASLFKLEITDYKGWAKGLKAAGYATFPKYAEMIISLVEKYDLTQYDKMVKNGKFKPGKTSSSNNTKPKDKPKNKPKVGKNSNYLGAPTEFEKIGWTPDNRRIYKNNGVKFIYAKEGETTDYLTEMFGIYHYQIPKYNDLGNRKVLHEGEMIYIEPKRRRADRKHPYHVVEQGETLSKISRSYGVKLKSIYKMNDLNHNSVIHPGDTIKLR